MSIRSGYRASSGLWPVMAYSLVLRCEKLKTATRHRMWVLRRAETSVDMGQAQQKFLRKIRKSIVL
jgi:hypothetical protein